MAQLPSVASAVGTHSAEQEKSPAPGGAPEYGAQQYSPSSHSEVEEQESPSPSPVVGPEVVKVSSVSSVVTSLVELASVPSSSLAEAESLAVPDESSVVASSSPPLVVTTQPEAKNRPTTTVPR